MFSGYSESGSGSQERGPTTFTFQPPGVVESRPAEGQAVPVQGGMKGQAVVGNTAQSINLDSGGTDQTIQALLKFSGDMLAPHIKAAKEEQFVTGMQRAASGEALTEIINEQPWYTKIFGDGPLVEGARAYEVDAKANKWATFHEENMDKLRMQSPDSIPKYLVESMNQHLTGDPATDTLIKANMIKVAPSLIKRQTKEHYKFLQERTSEQRSNAMLAAGDRLVSMRKDSAGMYGNEDFDNAEADLLAVSTPTEGADPKAFWHDFKGVLGVMAEKGNFHAINAYAKAGVFANIPIAERAPLERQLNQFQAYHAAQDSAQYAERLAKLHVMATNLGPNGKPLITAEAAKQEMDAINADYTDRTGNPALIVSKAGQVSTMSSAAHMLAKSAADQVGALVKAQGESDKRSLALHTLNAGKAALAVAAGDGKIVHEVQYEQWKQGVTPAVIKTLVHNATDTNPFIKAEVQMQLASTMTDDISDNFVDSYKRWKSIREGNGEAGRQATSNHYGEYDTRMEIFDKVLGGRDIKLYGPVAFQESRKERIKPPHNFTTPERAEVDKLLTDKFNPKWYSSNPFNPPPTMTPQAMMVLRAAAANEYADLEKTSPEPMKDSLNRALQRGTVEAVGGYAWFKSPDRKPLKEFLVNKDGVPNASDDVVGAAFHDTVAGLTKDALGNRTAKEQLLVRRGDVNGEAQFTLYIKDTDDRSLAPINFSSSAVLAAHLKSKTTQDLTERAAEEKTQRENDAWWAANKDKAPKAAYIGAMPPVFQAAEDRAQAQHHERTIRQATAALARLDNPETAARTGKFVKPEVIRGQLRREIADAQAALAKINKP